MRRAADIMTPAKAFIHVQDLVAEALVRFRKFDDDQLLVLDGDEVVGHLDRRALFAMEAGSPGVTEEMVGNVMETRIRICRPEDGTSRLRSIFDGDKVRLLAVTDETGLVVGCIPRRELLPDDPTVAADGETEAPAETAAGRSRAGDQLGVYDEGPRTRRNGTTQ